MAWRRTVGHVSLLQSANVMRMGGPTLDFDLFARLNAPAVRPHTVSAMLSSASYHGAEVAGGIAYCLGAVVYSGESVVSHRGKSYTGDIP
jgi:hypothetical protein